MVLALMNTQLAFICSKSTTRKRCVKSITDVVLVSLLLTDVTDSIYFSGISIVDFEQVNAGWIHIILQEYNN